MEREITLDLIQVKEMADHALQALIARMDRECENVGTMTLSVKVEFDYFALNEHETGSRPTFKAKISTKIKAAKPYEWEYQPDGYIVDGGKINLTSEQTEIEEAGA